MTTEERLVELGWGKANDDIDLTWEQIAVIMNDFSKENHSESYWRKKYKALSAAKELQSAEEDDEVLRESFQQVAENLEYSAEMKAQDLRDERIGLNKAIRDFGRQKRILDIIEETVQKFPRRTTYGEGKMDFFAAPQSEMAYVAMISDVHYGVEYDSCAGKYNPEIAAARLEEYRKDICANTEEQSTLYLVLAGDLISGNIHSTLQAQNRDDAVTQTMEISELIAQFIYNMSDHFHSINVYSVYGNHSRLDPNIKNILRDERLDRIPFWYAKMACANLNNIYFRESNLDGSIATFTIGDMNFAAVHGDMDKNLNQSVQKIEKLTHSSIDYMLSGHVHVAGVKYDNTVYITNGCVCGSGDDFSISHRLFAPAVQVYFGISPEGRMTFLRMVNLE